LELLAGAPYVQVTKDSELQGHVQIIRGLRRVYQSLASLQPVAVNLRGTDGEIADQPSSGEETSMFPNTVKVAGAFVVAASVLLGAGAGAASAATLNYLTAQPSDVICDTWGSSLTITPSATGSQNGGTQTIIYRYWILNRDTGQYVAGYAPTLWGSFRWAPPSTYLTPDGQPMFAALTWAHGPASTFVLPHGRYSVFTEYGWYIGGQWSLGGGWTESYRYYGVGSEYGSCTI
jgi:hypothetical protein